MSIQVFLYGEKEVLYQAAMKTIRGTSLGADMVRDIEASKNRVKIKAGQSNECIPVDVGPSAVSKLCYEGVVDNNSLHEILQRIVNTEAFSDPRVLRAMAKGEVQAIQNLNTKERSVAKAEWNGVSRGKVAYYLIKYLKPGLGADAIVSWNPAKQTASENGSPDLPWDKRPPWIGLAHELVHAWRMVTGRCVFSPADTACTIYEERMTVGIAPYDDGEPYTENYFRAHSAAPERRTFYNDDSKVKDLKLGQKYPR